MKRYIFSILIASIVAGLAASPAVAKQKTRGFGLVKTTDSPAANPSKTVYRALLIGNNDYASKKWPSLTTAIRDVEMLGQVLEERYGFKKENIRIVRNGTRRQMLRGFIEIGQNAGPNDSVLIYYGGHGEYDKNNRGWWVPVDGEEAADYIPNDDILARLRNIKAKHKLLISDSCFSGNLLTRGIAKSASVDGPISGYFREKSKLVSVQGFSSGGNEPVSDGGPEWDGHSVFAYHLIAALKANQKRYISASLLGHQLTEVVANDTASVTGVGQTPIVSSIKSQGDQGGEFFFVPTDIAARKAIPIIVFNTVPQSAGIKANLGKARDFINRAVMEHMQKQMLTPIGDVQMLQSNNFEGEIADKLKGTTAKGAIIVSISGLAKRQSTMFWQGLTRLELKLESYSFSQDRVIKLASHDVTAQQYPVRRWSSDAAIIENHYLKNAKKVIAKWSRPKLNQFLVQFEEQ